MASKELVAERIKALVAEVLAYEQAEATEAKSETINDIEDGMVRIADMVACEFAVQKLADHGSHPLGIEQR